MWNYKKPGIPDEYFERADKVPITKEEVRTIQLSKARLNVGQTVYDIGCGSGSISIEAALQIESNGKVLAVDYDKNAIELTKKNLKKFNLSNVSVIFGNAKEIILDLEEADVIFIGGTGGDTAEIVKLSENKLKTGGRIVIGTILIETLYSVLQILDKLNFNSVDITQVTISKSRKTTTGTMMLARNPVTIISATKA
jgi:cobalt-precorrin-6B (C15)-methyltransferase